MFLGQTKIDSHQNNISVDRTPFCSSNTSRTLRLPSLHPVVPRSPLTGTSHVFTALFCLLPPRPCLGPPLLSQNASSALTFQAVQGAAALVQGTYCNTCGATDSTNAGVLDLPKRHFVSIALNMLGSTYLRAEVSVKPRSIFIIGSITTTIVQKLCFCFFVFSLSPGFKYGSSEG